MGRPGGVLEIADGVALGMTAGGQVISCEVDSNAPVRHRVRHGVTRVITIGPAVKLVRAVAAVNHVSTSVALQVVILIRANEILNMDYSRCCAINSKRFAPTPCFSLS